MEEETILPTTSKAYWGIDLQIPNLELVESQNKLEEKPNGLEPWPKGINPWERELIPVPP